MGRKKNSIKVRVSAKRTKKSVNAALSFDGVEKILRIIEKVT